MSEVTLTKIARDMQKEKYFVKRMKRRAKIRIVECQCPKCNHNRAWLNFNQDYLKCSKCGNKFEGDIN